jgi:hypothetical protein
MKIFIFLNDCLLGENTTIELFFIFLKTRSLREIYNLIKQGRNIPNKLLEIQKEMQFDNLFLCDKVVTITNQYIQTYTQSIVYIVTNLSFIPLESLELDGELILCNSAQMRKEINTTEDYILITGDFWSNITLFFKAKKIIFVAPSIIGKLVDLISVGRTVVIDRSYGAITIIWDYFLNIINNIFILWPLLFFLPSTSFIMWKYAFFFSIILCGFASLWRSFLELEKERNFAVQKQEVLMGANFIFLHHSTFVGIIISLILLFITIIFGIKGFNEFRALIFSIIYSSVHFIFFTRKEKEYIIAKVITLLLLPCILQITLLPELFMIIFS